MGCYLGLTQADGIDEHGAFPVDKWAHNRDFLAIARIAPTERQPLDEFDEVIRPVDFDAWREAVLKLPGNHRLFLGMLDVMEDDETWWIRPSW